MKKNSLIFLIFFLSAIFLPTVYACIDIQLGRTNYFPSETFQAEITGSFSRALVDSNIFFYQDGKTLSIAFHREQMAANKYIVYAKLPSSYGNYKFSLKNVICIENKTTKTVSREMPFIISKPISDVYSNLLTKVTTWPSGDDGAFALLALSYDSISAAKGKAALLNSSRNGECWPSASCNVKSTSLAILGLIKSGNTGSVNKNWLLDSQNNIGIGLWGLIVNSSQEQQCNFEINNNSQILNIKAGDNIFNNLPLPTDAEIVLKLNCNVSAVLSHTYLGSVNKFPFQQGDGYIFLTLNNKKCFGKGYREECDSEATAYALFTLMNVGMKDTDAESWLTANMQGTVQMAITFMLTFDKPTKEWLVNNQANYGFWSGDALAINNKSSIEATVFSIEALKNENDAASIAAVEKAKAWLLQQVLSYEFNISQTSLALAYVFKSDQIEPLISIEPAIFKTISGSDIALNVSNTGIVDVKGTISLEGSILSSFDVNKSSLKKLIFKTPQKSQTTFSVLNMQYQSLKSNRSYSIPVLLWPAEATEAEMEQTIGESELNKSILPTSIRFLESSLNQTVEIEQSLYLDITNPSLNSVEVNILPSWDLLSENVIEITPSKFTMQPSETKEIKITVKKEGTFLGTIDAKTQTSTASIPVWLEIKPKALEKTCADLGGKICAETETCDGNTTSAKEGSCCVGTCKAKEKKMGWIGLVLIAVVTIAVILFLRLRLKKHPKKEIAEELKKIEERYTKPMQP